MTARLVHVVAAVVGLVVLVGAVGLHDGGVLPAYVATRDLVAAALGAVVVGLCLSGARRPRR